MLEAVAFIDARQDVTHPSYLYAGLGMLAQAGEIKLRFSHLAGSRLPRLQPGNVFSQVEVRSGDKTFLLAFDFKDQSNIFCEELLSSVDLYFKRSFLAADINRLVPKAQRKIVPLGMPFACRFPGELGIMLRDMVISGRPDETWKSRLQRFLQYLRITDARAFVATPPAAKIRRVIFQTRLWEKHEMGEDDVDAVNLPRVSLIRRLHKELGTRFFGGLVPTARARRDHPDLVRETGVIRDEYLALMRGSAVGISTRGLFHSTPWKLSEYLSTGIAVVTQPITNTPLDPLVEKKHILTFYSEDECLQHCTMLLDKPDQAAQMQQANRAYYETSVDPMTVVRRCLQRVVSIAG
jgi:glycosyl transferase family 1